MNVPRSLTRQLHGYQITTKRVKHLDMNIQNVTKTIIGQAMSFVNGVLSKLLMSIKVMTVVRIKLLYHAILARTKKRHG